MEGPLMVVEIGAVLLFAALFIAYLARAAAFQRISKIVAVAGAFLLVAMISYNTGYTARETDEAFAAKIPGGKAPQGESMISIAALTDIAAITIAAALLKRFDRRRRQLFEST